MKQRLLELFYAVIALLLIVFALQLWAFFVSMGLVCEMRNVPITDPFWLFTNCWFVLK